MGRWILAVLLALMQMATSTVSFGQQDPDQEPAFTREQWQERGKGPQTVRTFCRQLPDRAT
jgi:hypothetical protein